MTASTPIHRPRNPAPATKPPGCPPPRPGGTYDLSGPIDNARDQWIADQFWRAENAIEPRTIK